MMQKVTREDVKKLLRYPISYAMMMENCEIEHVVVVFVSALNKGKNTRGDKD